MEGTPHGSSNKDEALKCRALGVKALKEDDPAKAVRMFERAQRMYPEEAVNSYLIKARAQLAQKDSHSSSSNTAATTSSAAHSPDSAAHQHQPNGHPSHPSGQPAPTSSSSVSMSAAGATPPPPNFMKMPSPDGKTTANGGAASGGGGGGRTERSYSEEQEKACRQILKHRNHYDALGVPKNANEDAIKKAYRKLALQLHPDKNQAPSAEEAFKRVARAFQCLSDANRRAMYDQFGDDEEVPQQYRDQFDKDLLTPEELFQAFFSTEVGPDGLSHVVPKVRNPPPTEGQRYVMQAMQLLPIVAIVAVSFISSNIGKSPRYSLSSSDKYPVRRETSRLGLTYFLTREMAASTDKKPHKRDLKLEHHIEQQHIDKLVKACRGSQQLQHKAKGSEGGEPTAAPKVDTSSCERLHEIKNAHYIAPGFRIPPLSQLMAAT
ncbi:unnamed protein product [Vitrella brassicaformis CCMP3155]|uniref:J domain-containing protein n=2 Tax=Vitrella brassicaformis TaxID=1169539 RepID=A0A0G4EGP6_VITBC|nr:unnamed protein product [Vitrella brassicaformis CCMP3155]|eukprot:CEL95417.1 unnamed protein product [Vitrella brassicaformis CCMP3155]